MGPANASRVTDSWASSSLNFQSYIGISKGRTNSTVAATFPVHDTLCRSDSLVVPLCGIMEYIFRRE